MMSNDKKCCGNDCRCMPALQGEKKLIGSDTLLKIVENLEYLLHTAEWDEFSAAESIEIAETIDEIRNILET